MKKKLFAMTLATVLTASCFLGVTMQSEAASWQAILQTLGALSTTHGIISIIGAICKPVGK